MAVELLVGANEDWLLELNVSSFLMNFSWIWNIMSFVDSATASIFLKTFVSILESAPDRVPVVDFVAVFWPGMDIVRRVES